MKEFLNKFFMGLLVIIVILLSLWALSKVPFNIGAVLYIIAVIATLISCVIFWYCYLTRKTEAKKEDENVSEDEM